jgi:hypothetical protein
MNLLLLAVLCAVEPTLEQPAPSHWYGGASLALDAGGAAVLGLGRGMEIFAPPNPSDAYRGLADNFEGAGMTMLGLGAPLNHLFNGHPLRALISFLARTAAFSGLAAATEIWKQPAAEAAFGTLFVAVMLGDDLWLAHPTSPGR